jgi:hypothetical protein
MKFPPSRTALVTIPFLLSAIPAWAGELVTPALPASSTQYQECRILNVTGAPATVVTEAFNSNGVPTGGPYTQTLAPGEAGGFSLAGYYASMYCRFKVKGTVDGFRGSIDVLDITTGTIVVALAAT